MSYQRQWHLNARINASHRRKRVRLLLVIPVCALNGLILTSIIALLLWAADISSSAALLASFAGFTLGPLWFFALLPDDEPFDDVSSAETGIPVNHSKGRTLVGTNSA